jgi:adenylate kinase
MKDIILAWIQWCWKGTQAKRILKKYWKKVAYFETWNILRALMSNDNFIWEYLKDTVNKWLLVEDEFIIKLFSLFLETTKNKFILADGSLRKIWQTKGILKEFKKKWKKPLVIQLEIPEEEVYKRLATRKMCKNCGEIHSTALTPNIKKCSECWWELYVRNDDADIKAIKTRIMEYNEETVPALKYIESLGLLKKIDWMQDADKIFKQIDKLLKE